MRIIIGKYETEINEIRISEMEAIIIGIGFIGCVVAWMLVAA